VGRGVTVGMLSGYRVLGFDLETTGFNPRSDRVVQYALVGSDANGSHINLQSLVNPGVSIPEESIRVHGITNDDIRGRGEFGDHIADMASLMEGSIVVGHNVIDFDWRFVEMECMRIGVEVPRPHAIIDTLVIARRFVIPGSHKLGRLCDRFDIRLEGSHRADVDAGATLLLLWKMMQAYPRKFRGTVDEFIGSLAR
jgi:DNA polymerase-3 subunit epsilon